MSADKRTDPLRVLLVGNPNSGKTTLFHRLTGIRGKVGNYPGITVERRTGEARLPSGRVAQVLDLPGAYSLHPQSDDERVTRDELAASAPADVAVVVVVVVDGNSLARGLYLAVQVAERGGAMVVAINMLDELERDGIALDLSPLARALGVPVVAVSAAHGRGLEALGAAVEAARPAESGRPPRRDALDEVTIRARYAAVDAMVAEARAAATVRLPARSRSERIDDVLTHPLWGVLVFVVVMAAVFESLFAGVEPVVAGLEALIAEAGGWLAGVLPPGDFRGLVVDGVLAGVGNVVLFVPQIALLFFLIGVLEDSGYLARVAFVLDRLMHAVGLHGKAFVPMLSGFACAVPAVMATRTLEHRRDRILTMMVVPLMSCSARLPIYVLVTGTVFAGTAPLWGVFSAGAVVLFSMYMLSLLAALGAAAVLRRTVLRGPRPTFVMELPPYRRPSLRALLWGVAGRVRSFLVDAGTIILALTIVLWALLTYPKSAEVEARFDARVAEASGAFSGDALDARLAALGDDRAAAMLEASAAGRLGKAIEPILEPLGMDWRLGVAVIGAFAAREVFVSTLGVVFGISDATEESVGLRARLLDARRADGSPLFTPLTGVSVMVFFVLACQCMSTLAVVRRESGSWKWPALLFAYMTVLAYVASWLVYQGGRALGWT